jgi:hypothetical protein
VQSVARERRVRTNAARYAFEAVELKQALRRLHSACSDGVASGLQEIVTWGGDEQPWTLPGPREATTGPTSRAKSSGGAEMGSDRRERKRGKNDRGVVEFRQVLPRRVRLSEREIAARRRMLKAPHRFRPPERRHRH